MNCDTVRIAITDTANTLEWMDIPVSVVAGSPMADTEGVTIRLGDFDPVLHHAGINGGYPVLVEFRDNIGEGACACERVTVWIHYGETIEQTYPFDFGDVSSWRGVDDIYRAEMELLDN